MGIFFREGEEGKNGNVRELIEILISTDVNLFVHEVVVICCSLYREDAYNFDIASLIVSSCVFSQRCDRLTVSFLHKRCTFLFRRLLRELCILFFYYRYQFTFRDILSENSELLAEARIRVSFLSKIIQKNG